MNEYELAAIVKTQLLIISVMQGQTRILERIVGLLDELSSDMEYVAERAAINEAGALTTRES
jgi:hypothetical protein